jgi:hypothetical protein
VTCGVRSAPESFSDGRLSRIVLRFTPKRNDWKGVRTTPRCQKRKIEVDDRMTETNLNTTTARVTISLVTALMASQPCMRSDSRMPP